MHTFLRTESSAFLRTGPNSTVRIGLNFVKISTISEWSYLGSTAFSFFIYLYLRISFICTCNTVWPAWQSKLIHRTAVTLKHTYGSAKGNLIVSCFGWFTHVRETQVYQLRSIAILSDICQTREFHAAPRFAIEFRPTKKDDSPSIEREAELATRTARESFGRTSQ